MSSEQGPHPLELELAEAKAETAKWKALAEQTADCLARFVVQHGKPGGELASWAPDAEFARGPGVLSLGGVRLVPGCKHFPNDVILPLRPGDSILCPDCGWRVDAVPLRGPNVDGDAKEGP